MTTVAIVCHSGSGHTTKLAKRVTNGANAMPDVKVTVLTLNGKDIVEGRFKNSAFMERLEGSDAIIFGSPTYMGGPSGDKLSTMHYFFTLAMQHGMIRAGTDETPKNNQGINRLSSYSGVMAQAMMESPEEKPDAADKLTWELFGKRVAEAAKRWKAGRA